MSMIWNSDRVTASKWRYPLGLPCQRHLQVHCVFKARRGIMDPRATYPPRIIQCPTSLSYCSGERFLCLSLTLGPLARAQELRPEKAFSPPSTPFIDREGYSLPDGAVARLGSMRLRHLGLTNSFLPMKDRLYSQPEPTESQVQVSQIFWGSAGLSFVGFRARCGQT